MKQLLEMSESQTLQDQLQAKGRFKECPQGSGSDERIDGGFIQSEQKLVGKEDHESVFQLQLLVRQTSGKHI